MMENDHDAMGRKARRMFGCFGLIFGSLFLLVGCWVMGQAFLRGVRQRATASWPQALGTIIACEPSRREDDGRRSPLSYRFEVAGKIYRSDQIAKIDSSNIDVGDWLALANGLPESGGIPVFYNPDDPSDSVLKPGDHRASWSGLGFGALFAVFAACWMMGWWGISNWLPDRMERWKKERESSAE